MCIFHNGLCFLANFITVSHQQAKLFTPLCAFGNFTASCYRSCVLDSEICSCAVWTTSQRHLKGSRQSEGSKGRLLEHLKHISRCLRSLWAVQNNHFTLSWDGLERKQHVFMSSWSWIWLQISSIEPLSYICIKQTLIYSA